MIFGCTNAEKAIILLTAMVGWLMLGRAMRRPVLNKWDWISMLSGFAAVFYACYLAIANMPASTFGGH